MPLVARPWTAAAQLIGIVLSELAAPLADRFVGHVDAALEQEFLHVAVAQSEPVVEPDPVADNLAGKAVTVCRD